MIPVEYVSNLVVMLVMIIGSFYVMGSNNPVDSVLFLVLVFLNGAAYLILQGADFLGLIFIIIYVGAIAVLFLFIVMMLDIKISGSQFNFSRYRPFFGLYVTLFLLETYVPLSSVFSQGYVTQHKWLLSIDGLSNIEIIGQVLFSEYYFCVLLCGILLLIAMIGSIVLSFESKLKGSFSLMSRQISRKASLGIVKKI